MRLLDAFLRSSPRAIVAVLGATAMVLPTIAGAQTSVQTCMQLYNGPENCIGYAKAAAVDTAFNVYVTGYATNSGSGYDYSTIAYSRAGFPIWTNRYNGPGNADDRSMAIAVGSNGNVYVTGYSLGSDSGYDYATIAYSSLGTPLWTNRYSGSGNGDDRAGAIAADTNGNVYVTGYSANGAGGYDWVTVAYSSVGTSLWTNRYNGPGDWADYAFTMTVDTNVYVTGYPRGNKDSYDYATVAYSSAGTPLWTNRYHEPGSSQVAARSGPMNAGTSGSAGNADSPDWLNFLQSLSFTRDAHNPILSPTFNWEGSNIGDPVVIEESTEFRMYYSGFAWRDTNGVGLATAPKISPPAYWTKRGAVFTPNPVSGQWDSGYVRLGHVLKVGSTYYLYYKGTPNVGEAGTMRIGLATSTDGINFTRNSSNPILSPSYDEVHVENPTVIQTDATHWYMYYSYRTAFAALPGIRVATSKNGVNWTKIPGDVVSIGSGGEWDDTYVEHSQIYHIYDHYVLVYDGYGGSGNEPWAIGLAYSTDPTTNFTKFSGNPFFQRSGVSGAFDQFHVATAALFLQGDVWYLFFQGGNNRDDYGSSTWKFGLAKMGMMITTPSPLTAGAVGEAYYQTLTASRGTPPYIYTTAPGALPAGLSLSIDGVISGTPEEAGVANFRVQVTDANMEYSLRDFSLTINGPPTITTQPVDQSAAVGENAFFTVVAASIEPVGYQWRLNGNSIDGATDSVLMLSDCVASSDGGVYSVVVTNASGSVTSDDAMLTVYVPPWVVYDNLSTRSTPAQFAQSGGIEFGDEIVLAARKSRILTNFSFEYYCLGWSGNETLRFRIYANDLPSAIDSRRAPGALLYDSGVLAIAATTGTTLALQDLNVLVPTNFTWTVQFGGIEGGESAGLALFDPPVAGSNPPDYWERSETNNIWLLQGPGAGQPALNFGARAYVAPFWAIPDPPAVTLQPTSRTNSAGTTAAFTVAVSGTAPFSCHWFKYETNLLADGGNVTGAATTSLSLANVVAADGGDYRVVITNAAGSANSANATLTVIDPAIIAQPASRTNTAGTTAVFSVIAAGTNPAFQWGKGDMNLTDGGNVSGSTTASLTLADVQTADASSYTVVITTGYGSITSSPATLTVIYPPVVDLQPLSRTNNAGSATTFTVNANGTAPLSYQWQKGGVNLSNAGNILNAYTSALTFSSVWAADGGDYRVVITNAGGSATSASATLTVIDPAIVATPGSRTNNVGTTATFTVDANGTAPMGYQWRKGGVNLTNGGNVSGARTKTLSLSNVQDADVADYTVVVTNAVESVTSSPPARLTVVNRPVITVQPASRTNSAGTRAAFNVSATGTTPSYQWRKGSTSLTDGGNIIGTSTPMLTLAGVVQSDAASYSVVITNAAGSVTSSPVTLTVIDPAIIAQPASRTNSAGTTATFFVGAAGTEPLGYQWQKDGVKLTNTGTASGARTSTLTLSNVQAIDVAGYTVVVTNAMGSVTSAPATLTVIDPAVIAQPVSRTNNAGTAATFTASANGAAPMSYQWQKEGANLTNGGSLSGATTTTLILSNVMKGDEGRYRLAVTNAGSFAVSEEASLTVIDPVIVIQPTNQYAIAGSSATFAVVGAGTALEYQWQLNAADLADATNASLVVSNVSQVDDGGVYRVMVSNSFGSVISSNATLSLDWSLRFVKWFVNSNGSFQARLVAPPGSNVIIQGLLQGSPWTSFATNSASHGIIEFTDPMIYPDSNLPDGPYSTNLFYRAWLAP